jgi:micrococcal nuclease
VVALVAVALLALIGTSCASLGGKPVAAHHAGNGGHRSHRYGTGVSRYPATHHRKNHKMEAKSPSKKNRSHTPPPRPATASARPHHGSSEVTARVTRVVDGDTIYVMLHGRETDIRLIGIDTPETVDPNSPVMCYGPQASAFTHRELDGATVRLGFDAERHDYYGRTLAYVYKNGRMFNLALVRNGYARAYPYAPNTSYAGLFEAAQSTARSGRDGLWGACRYFGAPLHRTPDRSATNTTSQSSNCNPNYSGACIPNSSADLDCSDVNATNFRVVGDDVYAFDGDGDKVACES